MHETVYQTKKKGRNVIQIRSPQLNGAAERPSGLEFFTIGSLHLYLHFYRGLGFFSLPNTHNTCFFFRLFASTLAFFYYFRISLSLFLFIVVWMD